MESQRKYSRSGVLSIAIVAVTICVWWAIVGPRQYRLRKGESKTKAKLQEIQPPPGTILINMSTSHRAGWPEATGTYSTESDCDSVKMYYKDEFARHGFTFRDEDQNSKSETKFVIFSAPGYDAGLSCFPPRGRFLDYMIIMNGTNSRD